MSNHKLNLLLARPLISSLVLSLLIGVFSTVAFGQREFGQLTVKVTDQTDAVIAGASVKAKSATGAEKTATSDSDGIATISLLLPGEYDVEVSSGSFTPFKQKVQVNVGSTTSLDAKLGVTAGTTTVDITSGGLTEINTQDQQVSNVVTREQLENLPTINRNPYAFVALAGNATSDSGGATDRGAGFSLNGQRAASTNITLDGGDNVDSFTTDVGQAVPLDSVQEFRVTTSNFSAEYGRASGGIVNVSTRSGGNDFFGTAFWFHRNGSLAANDYDRNSKGQARPFSLRNQFGYSFGGPIVKDKLLFFSNTEWTRVRSSGATNALIPTTQLLAASGAATQNFFNQYQLDSNTTFGQTFTVGQVRTAVPGAFSNPALANSLPAFREVFYTAPANIGNGIPGDDTQTLNRIDWNINDRSQLYYRLAIQANTFQDGTNSSSPWAGFNTGQTNSNQNHLVNFAYTINPNLVSNTKFVYNRLKNFQPLGEQPVGPSLYLRSAAATNLFAIPVAFPGYLPFNPGNAIPFGGTQDIFQILQDLSWSKGKHNLKFGAQYFYMRNNRTFGAFQNAVFGLGVNNAAQGLDNLVAGNIARLQVAINPQGRLTPGASVNLPVAAPSFTRDNRAKDFAWYVNDSWRVSPRLTLNLGLRWEYYGVQKSVDPTIESNFYYGTGTTLEQQIRNGAPALVANSSAGQLWRPDWNNYAPRVGFAWDVFGNGKTSLRGGYGIAYERNFGNVTFNVIQNPPAYAVVTVNAGAAPFVTIPIPTSNFGPLAGNAGTVNLPGRLNIRHVDENIRTAYSHFWSVSFEREILPRLNFSVDYTGSAGRKLYDLTNPNRPGYGARVGDNSDPFGVGGGAVSSLINPNFYPLNTRGNRGKSDYQGITFSLIGNNFRNTGLTFSAKYTYSQAKDNLSSTFSDSVANNNLGLLDPFDPDLDYGLSDFDVKHRFVTGLSWDIPFAKGTSGFAKQALDGWSINTFFNANSGNPITLFDCTNAQFEVCPRINPVGGDIVVNRNLTDIGANTFSYITLTNPGAVLGNFINPQTGTSEVGPFPSTMTERNAFRNLGNWFFDVSAIKTFALTERYKLQFRSEFYNILNHANATVNFGTLDLSASPQVQVQKQPFNNVAGVPFVGSPRRIQFALRFMF